MHVSAPIEFSWFFLVLNFFDLIFEFVTKFTWGM